MLTETAGDVKSHCGSLHCRFTLSVVVASKGWINTRRNGGGVEVSSCERLVGGFVVKEKSYLHCLLWK